VEEDFATRMAAEGGADIILDTVGGPYLGRNVEALAPFGRIVTIGMQGGPDGTLNFAALMKKKASASGTLLRDRSPEQKTAIIAEVKRLVVPLLVVGVCFFGFGQFGALDGVVTGRSREGSRSLGLAHPWR
jgi:NADPH:quinone reductase